MSYTVGVIIISDRVSAGERQDECLPIFENTFDNRFKIAEKKIISDDPDMIERTLKDFIAKKYNLIFTSGGTGCAERDNTPEISLKLIKKPTPGIDEGIRTFSLTKTPYAIYSRAVSGVADQSLIINLPGAPQAVKDILSFLMPSLEHPLKLIANKIDDCQKEISNENL